MGLILSIEIEPDVASKDGKAIPRVERFDPLDVVPHRGDLFVVRVERDVDRLEADEPVLRYTLIGTRLAISSPECTGI